MTATITHMSTSMAPLSALPPWRWGPLHIYKLEVAVHSWDVARMVAEWRRQQQDLTPLKGFRAGTAPPLRAWVHAHGEAVINDLLKQHIISHTYKSASRKVPAGHRVRGVIELEAPAVVLGQDWVYSATVEAYRPFRRFGVGMHTTDELAAMVGEDIEAAVLAGLI